MKDLSIIIPSFNTKNIILKCLNSIDQALTNASRKFSYEIIVVDNASSDGSPELFLEMKKKLRNLDMILNKTNSGYAKANNQALKIANGRYILFLNSDIIIDDLDFEELLKYCDFDPRVGAVTVKVVLPSGKIDPASHRGFPTLWNSFCYFSRLENFLGKVPIASKIFGGYHMTAYKLNTIHEIDAPTGAFFLIKKDVLDKIGGFSEDFFMYGEDLDLAFRIKENGYRIIYYPLYQVTHLKYSSGLKKRDKLIQNNIQKHYYEAMKIFYKKHYENRNFWLLNKLAYFFINAKEKIS